MATLHGCIRPRAFCETCQVGDDLSRFEALARNERRTVITRLEINLEETGMGWHVGLSFRRHCSVAGGIGSRVSELR